jgi:hypothetical protein
MSASLLERRTGVGVEEWNRRVARSGADGDEKTLRGWLEREGVTGYPQQLLIFERFGYPDYLVSTADELIDAQYADRPQLRPILDRILSVASGVGDVRVQARKGYVTLVSPRRTFALIHAATKKRVDLGLRLDDAPTGGRLQRARSMPQGWATVKFELAEVADVDAEVVKLLRVAYQANL